jgi:hypothetical protein
VCGAQRAKRLKGNPTPEVERTYRAAMNADDKFQAALEKKYGSAAGDMRYRTRELPPAIRRLAMAKQRADAAYHKAVDKQRGNPRRKARKKNRGRRNPLDGALKTYEGFHGRPSEEIVEVTTELHEHSHLAGLGDLVKLVIVTDNGAKVIIQKFEDGRGNPAILCMNERPKNGEYKPQLFIEGGDQSVRLSDFGIFEPYHEIEVLGRCRNVYYYTRKDHLGSDGGTATYNHKFGGMREVKGRGGKVRRKRSPLPTVLYDTRNRLLSFAGGGYTIPDEGIDN